VEVPAVAHAHGERRGRWSSKLLAVVVGLGQGRRPIVVILDLGVEVPIVSV